MSALAADPLPAEPDKGFVTEVHKEKAGSIVFARSAAAVTTPEKPAEFVNAFSSKDQIFLRAYLPRSLNNAFRAEGVECVDPFRTWAITVDGKSIGRSAKDAFVFYEPLDERGFKESTSIRFDKPMNGAPDGDQSLWRAFHEHVAPRLLPGEHTITLAVRGQCSAKVSGLPTATLSTDLASGTFTFTVPAGTVLAEVMPTPAKKDKKLEADMARLLEQQWRGEKVLKLVIVDKDWDVERIMLKGKAVPQRRTINTKVAVQQADGCRIFEVSYVQPAKSFTAFGDTAYNAVGGSNEVACEAVTAK